MGQIRVLNERGDEPIEWDPADKQSVKAAKKRYAELKAEGYEFYEIVETKGKRVERFDKRLGKLIAAPGAKRETRTAPRPARAMAGGPTTRIARVGRSPYGTAAPPSFGR